jgi:hypothetical protein
MGLENPNFDGQFEYDATSHQEAIDVDLAETDLDEEKRKDDCHKDVKNGLHDLEPQLKRKHDLAEENRKKELAETKRKRALAKDAIAEDRERQDNAFDYVHPVYDTSPGTIEDIQAKLCIRSMKLRRDLNVSLKEGRDNWETLRRPTSMHSANMTLDEMSIYIPAEDREQETYIESIYERFHSFDLSHGVPFREIVGCLLWVCLCIMGPELLRVKDLARKSNCHTEEDFRVALKVLDRIYARRTHGIVIVQGGAGTELVPSSTRGTDEASSGRADGLNAPGDDIGSATKINELREKALRILGQLCFL